MAGTLEYGELVINLQDVYVMRLNRTTVTYTGSVGHIARPQRVEVTPVNDQDEIKSGGARLHSLSVKTSVNLTMSMAGMDYDARGIMTGGTVTNTGSAPNRQREFRVLPGGEGLPYFGMICTGSTEGGALQTYGVAAVMLQHEGGFMMDGETNAYSTSSQEASAVSVTVSAGNDLVDGVRIFEDSGDFTVPTNAASFKQYFTDFF